MIALGAFRKKKIGCTDVQPKEKQMFEEKLNKRKHTVKLARNWCALLLELVTGHSHGPPLLSMDSGVPDQTWGARILAISADLI